MPSFIPGFEYDIFISYRQKDNKYDGWVTEFVNNLKKELEATFKEEISIYFDINPHDGLLETHDVDASLKEKLKCLIFIPIISRTYCDPKSFAWEYEFKAFVNQVRQDQFGLKVKLPNGNVASRVLPIRIYDLDSPDIKLCESVLGGGLRGVEFIYKAAGVNRPLRASEDHPQDNLNKTYYRDQINKVANSIKEIIQGLSSESVRMVNEKDQVKEPLKEIRDDKIMIDHERPARIRKLRLISSIVVGAILILMAIIAYPKISKKNRLEQIRSSGKISVAVMPFQNMTNDTSKNFWQEIIQNNLITSLSNSEKLKVRQSESIITLLQKNDLTNYAKITSLAASSISRKLEANVFIHGSINQVGTTIRLNAKLIDSETNEVFKSFQIDGTAENILHLTESLSVMVHNYLVINILKKEASPFIQLFGSTKSPEALRYFIDGQNAFSKSDYPTAREMFLSAIKIDSNFTTATIFIAISYGNQRRYNDAKRWCLEAYEKRNNMPRLDKILTEWAHALYFGTPSEEIKYLRQMLEIDDQQAIIYYQLGSTYDRLHQYDKAAPEFEKSLEICKKWEIKPMWVYSYTDLGDSYNKTGQYKKEKKLYKKAEHDFPDDPSLIYNQAILAFDEGDANAANSYIDKYISIQKNNSASEADLINDMAQIYSHSGMLDKAEGNFRHALSLEPENPTRIYNLGNFLIENDLDINEGLELVDRALKLRPDDYNYIACKGWGFYKQGKFKEALELLQKSWDLKPVYRHFIYVHLEEAKKAVAGMK